MHIRTVLPALLLTGGFVLGATACEAGIEKKNDTAAPASSPTANGSGTTTGSGTGAPAPASASDQPSTSTPQTGKATPSAPASVSAPPAPSTPSGPGPLVISGTGTQPTTDCTGRDVRIEGDSISITLTGFCRQLTVTGASHSIEVSWFDKITVNGSKHLVLYGVKSDGSKPEILDNGTSDHITSL
ncbi:DUF3060 domain-containing protein [Embleya sp. AB8]|uniref:DUF3060 domain-containing protein n=1 Tax=Embleya sp. AB8 TaxID=3156304 RepID=UPI003C77D4D0